jgi:hypothetical protein
MGGNQKNYVVNIHRTAVVAEDGLFAERVAMAQR